MIKLSTLIQENTVIADKKPVKEVVSSTRLKDLFNENQVIRVENELSETGEHRAIYFHLSNGKVIKVEGLSVDDIIYVEVI